MKLRHAARAIVDREKVVGYLLNRAHPDNGGKAQFFESMGFSTDCPEHLQAALSIIARTAEIRAVARSPHGEKYVADGWLPAHTETSRHRLVRTVWIIDVGRDVPRLVTAYPVRSESHDQRT